MRMSLRAVNTEGISTNNGGLMVIYMIILLPFLSISGVTKLLDAGQYQAYQSASFVLLAGLVILKARHLRLNKFTLLYIAYQLWVLLMSTKNNDLNLGLWVVVFSGIFIVMLLQVDMPAIVRALTWLTVSAVIINLVYMFYLGSYGQQEYFVGGKNSFSIFMVPSAFLLIINTLLRKKTLNKGTYLYVALVTFCILWGGSATGMVTAVAMIAGLFWITRKNPKIKTVMTVMIIMNVLLVFFTKVLIDSGLWRGFTSILGKDISLTSRTGIWESVVRMLRSNWLMGFGRGTRIVFVGQWSKRSVVSETHNFLLEENEVIRVHHLWEVKSLAYRNATVVSYGWLTSCTLLSSDDDDTVRTTSTINRSCRCILKYVDRLDIVRVDCVHCLCLLWETVDNIERSCTTCEGTSTTDHDIEVVTRTTV